MKNKKPKPLAKFRIYGWHSSLYFLVCVWKTKKEMLKNWDYDSQPIGKPLPQAFTHPYTIINFKDNKTRVKPILGEIHLYKKKLGTEVITHESTHATMSLLRRLKFDFNKVSNDSIEGYMKNEEVICYCIGFFARQIVFRLYQFKLL